MKTTIIIVISAILIFAGTVITFGADPTYYSDYLKTVSKTDPQDTELANTIGAWIRQTRGSVFDTVLVEHDNTGVHKRLTVFSPLIATTTNVTIAATNAGSFFAVSGTNIFTFSLPSAASVGAGRGFCFKRIDANTNTITIAASGGAIEGQASVALTNSFQTIWAFSDGNTNYYSVSQAPLPPTPYINPTKVWLNLDGSPKSVSATQAGGLATITASAPHGISLGDIVKVSGCTQTNYNVVVALTNAPGSTTISYNVDPATASPATGTPIIETVCKKSSGVSSVGRNSAGNYTVNFTTPFANTNYVVLFNSFGIGPGSVPSMWMPGGSVIRQTNSLTFGLWYLYLSGGGAFNGGAADAPQVDMIIATP